MPDNQATTSRKTATTLLLYDAKVKTGDTIAHLFAEQVLKCNPKECVLKVKSLKELVLLLRKYETIDHLVLYFHGNKGGILVGGAATQLSDLARLFTGHEMFRAPKINKQIDFEACRVGEGPDELFSFAKIFKAP